MSAIISQSLKICMIAGQVFLSNTINMQIHILGDLFALIGSHTQNFQDVASNKDISQLLISC